MGVFGSIGLILSGFPKFLVFGALVLIFQKFFFVLPSASIAASQHT